MCETGHGWQVTELLHTNEDEQRVPGIKADLVLAAVRVLAAAGAAMRAAAPEGFAAQAEGLQGELLQLCCQGAPKAAKAAVRCARRMAAPATKALPALLACCADALFAYCAVHRPGIVPGTSHMQWRGRFCWWCAVHSLAAPRAGPMLDQQ